MEKNLNITNGDSAIPAMKEAGIQGDFLPWRDVLHDGPVPADLPLEKLSRSRAQFIIDQGWGDPKAIKEDFVQRDETLCRYRDYSKVILWFEHDLYDQLQILQILDWFSDNPPEETNLTIICTEQYLGMATADQMKGLLKFEEDISEEHLSLAKKAWAAFRSPLPIKWQRLLEEDTSILPFLRGAILRMLQEYPDCKSGLSRTACIALDIISKGEKKPGKVFGCYQETEERKFMGDSSFWVILNQLLKSNPPLLELSTETQLNSPPGSESELSITAAGNAVLAGEQSWLNMAELNRWVGGVHLTPTNIWCWNSESHRLSRISESNGHA